ncbi:DgyrCDS14663 [Dimorphilus gyrociliatus]|uniref:DgyrCDS14663 n=1 Tax=Dimorphilus gyrociliatus TaxID=2664684 RepID=A0A7I8WET9_9ANNE|nr:DgyrCDS14663 [Dimorphilus gyrociliatus]
MKDHVNNPSSRSRQKADNDESTVRQSLLNNGPSRPQNKYTKLENEIERSNSKFIEDHQAQQQLIIKSQDEEIDRITSGVGVLKNVSRQIGSELDEQAVMLDEFNRDMDRTDTRMDSVMKKMTKVLHLSNDRRQWCAIGVLLLVFVIVIILFFVI